MHFLTSLIFGAIGGALCLMAYNNGWKGHRTDGVLRVGNQDLVIDIDIGTFGSAIDRDADRLVTFDPFDVLEINEKLERYPYVVSDFNGTGKFFINTLRRSCSTMNMINTFYSERLRDERMLQNCGNISLPLPGAKECAHPGADAIETKVVQVRRLCDLLKQRGFTKVNKMKIDAQGTDFVILKDVLENCPHVSFNEIKLECQVYEKTIPLYMTDNDCPRIEAYVRDKFPNVSVKWELNVCWSGEYNLIFKNLTLHSTDV